MPLNLGRPLFTANDSVPLQNYNYIDIASAQGYVNYYAIGYNGLAPATSGSIAGSFSLISEILDLPGQSQEAATTPFVGIDYSYHKMTTGANGPTTPSLILMKTSKFNLPKDINGNINLIVPVFVDVSVTSASSGSSGALRNFSIQHFDSNNNPTLIASNPTILSLEKANNSKGLIQQVFFINFENVKKHIKKNEAIGVSFSLSMNTPAGTGPISFFGFCHNPGNSSVVSPDASNSIQSTKMLVQFPFKIDLV